MEEKSYQSWGDPRSQLTLCPFFFLKKKKIIYNNNNNMNHGSQGKWVRSTNEPTGQEYFS